MMLGLHHKLDPQDGNAKREDENKQKNPVSYGFSLDVLF